MNNFIVNLFMARVCALHILERFKNQTAELTPDIFVFKPINT